jgi:ABC-2 type transport system ATP-binding protein
MRSEEKTIVISSHQLTDLERFADHVGIVHQGRLLISGRMDTLIERFCEVEVQLPSADWAGGPGLKLLSQTGNRASVLVDRVACPSGIPIGKGINVIGESGVTLEELFLGLVQESGSVAVEEPR